MVVRRWRVLLGDGIKSMRACFRIEDLRDLHTEFRFSFGCKAEREHKTRLRRAASSSIDESCSSIETKE